MRVLLGTIEIAGFYSRLVQGFRQIGVEADLFLWNSHPFKYGEVHQPEGPLYDTARLSRHLRPTKVRRRAQRLIGRRLLKDAASRYDAFIFGYNSSIHSLARDLPLFSKLGRKAIFVYHGSDARPGYISGFIDAPPEKRFSPQKLANAAAEAKATISLIERHAHALIVQEEVAHFMTKPFVPFTHIGLPCLMSAPSAPISSAGEVVRVLHCPSRPVPKGTYEIREAIETLRGRGRQIEFIELIGRSNAEVMRELARCDFVVDELYSDAPMAGFSSEAATFAKPAIIGSYGIDLMRERVPEGLMAPSHLCHPDDIVEAIDHLISDVDYRLDLGRRAREFVVSRWTAKQVATNLLKVIQGEAPESWWSDPGDVAYLHGMGLTEAKVKRRVGEVIKYGGIEALQIGDKPKLEEAFMKFADIPD